MTVRVDEVESEVLEFPWCLAKELKELRELA